MTLGDCRQCDMKQCRIRRDQKEQFTVVEERRIVYGRIDWILTHGRWYSEEVSLYNCRNRAAGGTHERVAGRHLKWI